MTCPYTSEQNGLVERKHGHIVDTCLTLLAHALMPLKFWPYAFATSVYLINRPPTIMLKYKSPLELLYKVKPHYLGLRVFRCPYFPYLRCYNTNKLSFGSSPCTFLGYATNQKGYKCLDANGRIYLSRHVVLMNKNFLLTSQRSKPTKNIQSKIFLNTNICSTG